MASCKSNTDRSKGFWNVLWNVCSPRSSSAEWRGNILPAVLGWHNSLLTHLVSPIKNQQQGNICRTRWEHLRSWNIWDWDIKLMWGQHVGATTRAHPQSQWPWAGLLSTATARRRKPLNRSAEANEYKSSRTNWDFYIFCDCCHSNCFADSSNLDIADHLSLQRRGGQPRRQDSQECHRSSPQQWTKIFWLNLRQILRQTYRISKAAAWIRLSHKTPPVMECICASTANQWQVSPTCSGSFSYITISDWGRDSRQVQIAGQRSTWRGEFCGLQSCTHATEMSQSKFKCQVSHGIEFKHSYVELVTLSAMLSLESWPCTKRS